MNGKNIVSLFSANSEIYSVNYIPASGDNDWTSGNLPFTCFLKDTAGNTVSVFLPVNTLSGDATQPIVLVSSLYPSLLVVFLFKKKKN